MLLAKPLNAGDLRGVIYDFPKVGDQVPKHVHDESNNHITIITKGKIKIFSHDWEMTYVPGDVIDFRPYEPHCIEALEENSQVMNIIKNMHGSVNDTTIYTDGN